MKNTETVLVTGGSRGIGKEICRAFSKAGYFVFFNCNKSADEAQALKDELVNADFIQCDLSSREGVKKLTEFCKAPDVIVNNAGASLVKPFDTVTDEEEEYLYRTNLLAPVSIVRHYLPSMISRKKGVIINVSSIFGRIGGSCEVDYSASKAALIGFTKALAKEVGPSEIRVNCVCPGIIDTDMNGNLSPEELEDIAYDIPLERLGLAKEVAESVLFLASEKSAYVTGAVLDVNGGWF